MITFSAGRHRQYQLIAESSQTDYYLTDRGEVLAVPSGLPQEERKRAIRSAAPKQLRIKSQKSAPYKIAVYDLPDGDHHKEIIVKIAVVEHFTRVKVKYAYQLQHKNKNPLDCSLNNLVFYSLEEAKHLRSGSHVTVFFEDGKIQRYANLKAAAKALFVSRTALQAFMNGDVNNSCLRSKVRKVIEE